MPFWLSTDIWLMLVATYTCDRRSVGWRSGRTYCCWFGWRRYVIFNNRIALWLAKKYRTIKCFHWKLNEDDEVLRTDQKYSKNNKSIQWINTICQKAKMIITHRPTPAWPPNAMFVICETRHNLYIFPSRHGTAVIAGCIGFPLSLLDMCLYVHRERRRFVQFNLLLSFFAQSNVPFAK